MPIVSLRPSPTVTTAAAATNIGISSASASATILPADHRRPTTPNSSPHVEDSPKVLHSPKMANTAADASAPPVEKSQQQQQQPESLNKTKGQAAPPDSAQEPGTAPKISSPPQAVPQDIAREAPHSPSQLYTINSNHGSHQQGYTYVGYRAPPSPAGMGSTLYDNNLAGTFHTLGSAGSYGAEGGIPSNHYQAPNSPSQNSTGIPPASPLWPRITGQATAGLLEHAMPRGIAPLSPGPPYLSPVLGPSTGGMYLSMNAYPPRHHHQQQQQYQQQQQQHVHQQQHNGDGIAEEYPNWNDNNRNQSAQFSPQMSAQGIPIPYVPGMPPGNVSGRSYSFDEMLPGPAIQPDQKSQGTTATQQTTSTSESMMNPAYSPYGSNSMGAGMAGSSMFAHPQSGQQQWSYGAPAPDAYSPGSPLQARPTTMQPYASMPGVPNLPRMPTGGPYMASPYSAAQYFPATSPGPPIQTSASNKGPDRANLFIFHIPNHFSNVDMYNLFAPFGNLLSVRIMVERETGRSRGFGFVSYDNPESAALAIRELNQYPIGNKRLKVQLKQMRNDSHGRDHSNNDGGDEFGNGPPGAYGDGGQLHALPPSGATAANNWYAAGQPPQDGHQPLGQDNGAHEQTVNNEGTVEHNVDGGAVPGAAPVLNSPLGNMDPLLAALPETTQQE